MGFFFINMNIKLSYVICILRIIFSLKNNLKLILLIDKTLPSLNKNGITKKINIRSRITKQVQNNLLISLMLELPIFMDFWCIRNHNTEFEIDRKLLTCLN